LIESTVSIHALTQSMHSKYPERYNMAKIINIIMPSTEQEGTTSVIEKWFKNQGDPVKTNEPILEVNTDKVTMEISSPTDGVLMEILKQEGEEVTAGEVLGKIDSKAAAKTKETLKEAPVSQRRERKDSTIQTRVDTGLSPAVKYLIKKHNIDIEAIQGSGAGSRVTAADIEQYLAKTPAARKPAPVKQDESPQSTIPGKKIPHSRMRKRIAEHMVESMLKTAPHVTAIFDADMSAIIAHREKERKKFEKKGVKLTFTAYFVQAAVKSLQAVPEANSRWHEDALEIFEDCNIGIATALDDGLIVPVIQKAQKLDLFKTASILQDLTARAREGKLKPDEVQNGTFTITNHGVSGSLIATPIINQPQSAILGIGKLEKRVIVVEKNGQDTTEIKPMVYVTLTIDHRVLDGFKANQFLSRFVEILQKWKK